MYPIGYDGAQDPCSQAIFRASRRIAIERGLENEFSSARNHGSVCVHTLLCFSFTCECRPWHPGQTSAYSRGKVRAVAESRAAERGESRSLNTLSLTATSDLLGLRAWRVSLPASRSLRSAPRSWKGTPSRGRETPRRRRGVKATEPLSRDAGLHRRTRSRDCHRE